MLRSYNLKLGRAREHVATLDDEIQDWRNGRPYSLSTQLYPDELKREWRIHIHTPMRDEWSTLIGECLHNARGALDHMAYLLAIVGNAAQAELDREKITFPICDRPSKWPRPDSPKIRAIEPLARAEIERAQPYHAAEGVGGTSHDQRVIIARSRPLWILHDLNNTDKHRQVMPAFISVPMVLASTKRPESSAYSWSPPPGFLIEDNAVIARVVYSDMEDAVEMHDGPLIQECLNEWDFEGLVRGIPAPNVVARLDGIVNEVEAVIDLLEPFLV